MRHRITKVWSSRTNLMVRYRRRSLTDFLHLPPSLPLNSSTFLRRRSPSSWPYYMEGQEINSSAFLRPFIKERGCILLSFSQLHTTYKNPAGRSSHRPPWYLFIRSNVSPDDLSFTSQLRWKPRHRIMIGIMRVPSLRKRPSSAAYRASTNGDGFINS